MTATVSNGSAHPLRGIALMTAAMLTIPIVDGLAKHLSAGYSPLFLGWMRYAVASVVVLPLAAARYGRDLFPNAQRPSHLLRTVFLVAAMTLYFLAIARIPLATAVSAFFVGPIIAVVLAAVVLKERLTARKLLSLALGFAGALVIARPGTTIEPGIALALGAGVCFACYLVATRRAAQDSDPLKTLAFQCAVGAILLMPQAVFAWSMPAPRDLGLFAALGVCSAISHLLSIAAFRLADASTLAPLVYIELVGAALIGYFAFGDLPSAATAFGAACIVAGGCVLLMRGPARRR